MEINRSTLSNYYRKNSVFLIALLISILYFLFHFHFMQRYIDHDQVVYVNNIIKAVKKPFVNPHHLHFEISGRYFHNFIVKYFGEYGFTDITFNLRLRSMLFSSIGIFFSILYLSSLTGRLMWGILSATLMAFTHGYLLYSPKVDTAVFSTTWIIVMLYAAHRLTFTMKFYKLAALITGIVLFTGIMLHQYLGLTCAALFFSLVVPEAIFKIKLWNPPFKIISSRRVSVIRRSPGGRYSAAAIMTLTATLLTVSAYFYAGRVYLDLSFDKPDTSWNYVYRHLTFQEWIFFYKTTGDWGKEDNSAMAEESFRGLTDAFLSPRKPGPKWNRDLKFNYNIANPGEEKSLVFNQLAFYLAGSLMLFVLLAPGLWRRYNRDLLAIILNLGFFTYLAAYWEPFYMEFWVIPAVLFIFLSVLTFNFIGEKISPFLSRFSQVPFYLYILFFTSLISAHNIRYNVVPQSMKMYIFGVGTWEDSEYYMKMTGRKIYKNYNNPHRDVYDIKQVKIDWK